MATGKEAKTKCIKRVASTRAVDAQTPAYNYQWIGPEDIKCPMWIKKGLPPLPCFFARNQVAIALRTVKSRMYVNIIQALQTFFQRHNIKQIDLTSPDKALLWILACITRKYGRIYLISRSEAKQVINKVMRDEWAFREIEEILLEQNLHTKAINCAVFSFLGELKREGFLRFSSFKLPPYSFLSASKDSVYVNEQDVTTFDRESILDVNDSLYDLHDFAHYCCALLNSDLYGSKMFQGFSDLLSHYRDLILSADFLNPNSYKLTDNFLFRQMSLYSFDQGFESNLDEAELTIKVTQDIYEYMTCKKELIHPHSGRVCKPASLPTVLELAVLAQNKCYEHSASEFEEQFFIRCGPDDKDDPFVGLSVVEFLNSPALDSLSYYELRNFVRHRAISNAYIKCAERLNQRKGPEGKMARTIKSFLEFDLKVVAEVGSLYRLVHESDLL